jgi:uncharacterized membrane protein
MPAGQAFFSTGAGVATGTVVGAALGVVDATGAAGIVVGATLGIAFTVLVAATGGATIGSGFPEQAARARAVATREAERAWGRIARESTGICGARIARP